MVYLMGTIGFLAGFYAGLMILRALLRGKTNDELKTNKSLWWKYGWIVWITAFFGIWAGIETYRILWVE